MVRDACIGAGQRTRHAFWMPLRHILDNFVSLQVNSVDSFSLVKKMQFHAPTACPIGTAVENDTFCFSQGTVATFFMCGGQVQKHLCRISLVGHLCSILLYFN